MLRPNLGLSTRRRMSGGAALVRGRQNIETGMTGLSRAVWRGQPTGLRCRGRRHVPDPMAQPHERPASSRQRAVSTKEACDVVG